MKRILLILILTVVLIRPQNVLASCAGPLTLSEYKNLADAVLVGVAESSGGISEINVEDVYKGNVGLKINVTGAEGPEGVVSSVDFSFTEASRYLLFLNEGEDGTYRTNICNGNKVIGDEGLLDEELAMLQEDSTTPDLEGKQKEVSADERVETQTVQNSNNSSSLFIAAGLLTVGALGYWVFRKKK